MFIIDQKFKLMAISLDNLPANHLITMESQKKEDKAKFLLFVKTLELNRSLLYCTSSRQD